jgi:hypothetical protein
VTESTARAGDELPGNDGVGTPVQFGRLRTGAGPVARGPRTVPVATAAREGGKRTAVLKTKNYMHAEANHQLVGAQSQL